MSRVKTNNRLASCAHSGTRTKANAALALEDATTLYLNEGAVEQTKPFTPGPKDIVTAQTWTGITMVGELDVQELRYGDGKTAARGNWDVGLGEPT